MSDINKPRKKRKPLSAETKMKISEKRRARTRQPRNASQSKKSMSLYSELKEDYKKSPEALKWLEENKESLGYVNTGDPYDDAYSMIAIAKEWGVQTEFSEMYCREYEEKVGSVLYNENENSEELGTFDDPYNLIDDEYGLYEE